MRGRSRARRRRPPSPGSGAPREVNLIAKDYSFLPDALDLIPGETVLLHVVNGGLEIHEAVIGDQAVQDAWEVAEAATVGAPPGPTPVVSVPPDVSGIRIVVATGQAGGPGRIDPGRRVGAGRAGVDRRLPHPGPLGPRDAHPGSLVERLILSPESSGSDPPVAQLRLHARWWYALCPAQPGCTLTSDNLEEDPGWLM